MKYYRICHSLEKIGLYPQVRDAITNFDMYGKDSAYHSLFKKATSDIEFPIPILAKKATKTDLLSSSFMSLSFTLIVSEKLKLILEDGPKEGIQMFESSLIDKKGLESKYWLIHPHMSRLSFLDVANTQLKYTDAMGSKTIAFVKFVSIDQLILAIEKNRTDAVEIAYPNHKPLVFAQLAFDEHCEVDFFSLAHVRGGIGFYVSEKIKNRIQQAKCSGIVFKEPNEIYP